MELITRRHLFGSAAVVVAGGVGLAVGMTRPRHQPTSTPPRTLVDAVARERDLIASLDAAAAVTPSPTLTAIRADHEAHRAALQALVDRASAPVRPPSTASPAAGPPPAVSELLAAEKSAQASAAAASAGSTGALAALFASISACEAGHQALLA